MREDHLADGREANTLQLGVREEGYFRDLGSVGPEFTTKDLAPEDDGHTGDLVPVGVGNVMFGPSVDVRGRGSA